MTRSRQHKGFPPTDDETDGTTDNETNSLFDESDDDTDDTVDTEILSYESDHEIDVEAWLSDEEAPPPPECYLAEGENLNVKQLQQRRYSLKT